MALPTDLATINRVKYLLQNRRELNSQDIAIGLKDDTLDNISLKLKTQSGELLELAARVKESAKTL